MKKAFGFTIPSTMMGKDSAVRAAAVAVGEVIKTSTKGFVSGLIDSEMRLKHLRSVCR